MSLTGYVQGIQVCLPGRQHFLPQTNDLHTPSHCGQFFLDIWTLSLQTFPKRKYRPFYNTGEETASLKVLQYMATESA